MRTTFMPAVLGTVLAVLCSSLAVVTAPMPTAAQTGFHYIVGLNPQGDNFLALRSATNGAGYRMAKLGPETLLAPTGQRVGRWLSVEVINTRHAGLVGWVFDRYVACCSGAAPQPAGITLGEVVHPGGAALNLRRGPSLSAPVIGSIPNGTSGIPVSECIYESQVRSWCQVNFRGRNGWVSTRYFVRY